jgi:hypothetical protein
VAEIKDMKMKSRIVEFWGRRRRITPRLIDKIFGDGKQIIYITPLNTRPNYYIVCIDSKVDISGDSFLDSVLGEIQEEIEGQYGPSSGPRGGMYKFPAPDWDCGYAWGVSEKDRVEVQRLRRVNAKVGKLGPDKA